MTVANEVAADDHHAATGPTPITPDLAHQLFERIAPLREADGCRLERFDTRRVVVVVDLRDPSGAPHPLEVMATPARGWNVAAPGATRQACGATTAAIERMFAVAPQPVAPSDGGTARAPLIADPARALLVASFVVLLLGTARVLVREWRTHRPPPLAVAALAFVSSVALALRLALSPRTFLHEYYHVAETVSAYFTDQTPGLYGETGPALYRALAALAGHREDVRIVFLTNAVLASLAIPAVGLLDLALVGSFPRAVCAATVLAVLPQHLRFSASEDLLVLGGTFGLWALALVALYARTRRWDDALLATVAASLAMQARPELLPLPAVAAAMVVFVQRPSPRALLTPAPLVAATVLAALLVPRAIALAHAGPRGPSPVLAHAFAYPSRLGLLDPRVTPPVLWLLLAAGVVWSARRRPRLLAWVAAVFVASSFGSLLFFDNPQANLRYQLLPACLLPLVAAGATSLVEERWPGSRRAMVLGAGALVAVGVFVVVTRRSFVTRLFDQQLEVAFLERAVVRLPRRGALLSTVEHGRHALDPVPAYMLRRAGRSYELLFYQGMYCYFAFEDEPPPSPMTPMCRAVHERYDLEPVVVEEIDAEGYSSLRYAPPPYTVGFYRLGRASAH